jgi:hypothetical protein
MNSLIAVFESSPNSVVADDADEYAAAVLRVGWAADRLANLFLSTILVSLLVLRKMSFGGVQVQV